jgi:hypothetical protein
VSGVDDRATRRQAIVATLGAVGGVTTWAGIEPGVAAADATVPSDPEVLTKALAVERLMVLAYRRVLASGALKPGDAPVLQTLLRHELEHVSTVAGRLEAMGAPATTAPLDLKTADAMLGQHHIPGSLTDLHTRHDSLRLLVDLESVAEGVYFTALKTLGSAELLLVSAQTMACEAQHWTVISGLRNPGQYVKSVPWPFVTGSS